MKSIRIYCLFVALLFGLSAKAQLTVDASYTPQQLVQDVLVGQGVQVSNIQFTGNVAAKGYFDGSASNIGFAEGVILSTGRVNDAAGPNSSTAGIEEATGFNGAGDAQLTAISGLATADAAILEFDFEPSSDSVQFRYVFASNEYMTWVDPANGVNDVFAFLISGPGINGEQNIAVLPGTTTPITMQNVNADVNAQYYIDNGDEPNEQGGALVSYNGFTTVITASAVLTPCQTYHIRLAIADAGDDKYDSAVFLEGSSFESPVITINGQASYAVPTNPQQLVEGCSSMTLTFERSGNISSPLTTNVNFSGTATVGADISNIPSAITFAAGSSTVDVTFDVIEDGITEGIETLTIELQQIGCGGAPSPSVTISIEDAQPMTLQITPPVTFTCPQQHTIDVTTIGGYPPFSYSWSGSSQTGASITEFPLSTTFYEVDVTDACGFIESATTSINTSGYIPLVVNVEDVVVCGGEDALLEALVTGGIAPYSFTWNGVGGSSPYSFSPTQNSTVEVVVIDNCSLTDTTEVEVLVDEMTASFDAQLARHDAIQFTNTSDGARLTLWDFGDGTTGTDDNPLHYFPDAGTYLVLLTVTNRNGCTDTISQEVTVYPPLHSYVPNSFTPNADGMNDVFGMIGEGYLYYDLVICDRWGKELVNGRFENELAWDGTLNGKLVPSGMYVYYIFVQPPIGIEIRETGILHVLSGQ